MGTPDSKHPILALNHPLIAGTQGRSLHGQQCHPWRVSTAGLGEGTLVLWEPGLGRVPAPVLGLGHFCRGGGVLPAVGRVKGQPGL